MRLLRWLFLFGVIFLLPISALARVVESKSPIVDRQAHLHLKALSDRLGFLDTELPKGHAVASFVLSGCNFSVLVVGAIEGDAKRYARLLDDWRSAQGLPGDVRWSQEDDSAAAVYRYQTGGFGAKSASTTVDLPSLRRAVMQAEPQTQFAVSEMGWTQPGVGLPPEATSSLGTRYWNDTRDRPDIGRVTGAIVLPAWMPVVVVTWFLLLPVGTLIAFGIGIAIAKQTSIPVERRRKLYGRVVLGGVFGLLVLHGILVAATLPTKALEPLTQLWFGQRFAQFALPIVPIFAIVPILALPLMNKVEKRLLGPSEEEKRLQAVELKPTREVVVPHQKLTLILTVVSIAIGAAMKFWASQQVKGTPNTSTINLVGTIFIFLPMLLRAFALKQPKYSTQATEVSEFQARLQERVDAISHLMGLTPPRARILTEAIYGKFAAVLDRRGVGVSVHAMEQLTPGDIDFLVAHELAHQKLGHLAQRRAMMAFTLVPSFATVGFMSYSMFTRQMSPTAIFIPLLLGFVFVPLMGFPTRRMMRKQEFEADALAVQTTGDPQSAADALRKITLNDARPGVHDMDMGSHPAVADRIKAILQP